MQTNRHARAARAHASTRSRPRHTSTRPGTKSGRRPANKSRINSSSTGRCVPHRFTWEVVCPSDETLGTVVLDALEGTCTSVCGRRDFFYISFECPRCVQSFRQPNKQEAKKPRNQKMHTTIPRNPTKSQNNANHILLTPCIPVSASFLTSTDYQRDDEHTFIFDYPKSCPNPSRKTYSHVSSEVFSLIYTYTHICIYLSIYLSLSLSIHIYIYRERETYTYIYIYVYTHIHTHIYIYISITLRPYGQQLLKSFCS